ncbi:acyltransferase 3 [Novosphingobium sp. Rr 2-17]|uniref:acyltransferase family protein n=1 Tax=Novosphingobium sp. Rr 2-17 TaxID=555793 RepID=UPI0002697AEB|nr:acyltransferase [Novosphingobium sp. Rr 2-17]EIZ81187.1 acyltransferase 3 [Novosphingobium sp. Rr 2-17]
MTQQIALEQTAKPHRVWLTYLDGWRGFSVLAVLAAHFFPIPIINTGRLGVETFFCLSGRLMAGILFVERYPLDQFIYRRLTRVWPALYAFVLLVALACWQPGPLQVTSIDVLGALTFTANYTGIYLHRSPAFDHLWSLAVEEWAYLLLALLALGCRRFGWWPIPILLTCALLCIANGVAQTMAGLDYYAVYWRTDVRLASILLPCAFFLMLQRKKIPSWLPVFAAIGGIALNINRVPDPIKYSVGTACLAFAMVTIDVSPAQIRTLLSMRWVRQAGLWSFSLYLWQQPFAKAAGLPVINLAMAFACALISFYFIENPARRFLNHLPARIKSAKK